MRNAGKSISKRTHRRTALTLVEMLVAISVVVLLMSFLLPTLGRARNQAKSVTCAHRLRQLGLALHAYADDYDAYAMPTIMEAQTHWWGRLTPVGVDHTRGFLWPYLAGELGEGSLYECPAQPYGTYGLQGKPSNKPDDPNWMTSTYGYNGYFLSPAHSTWSGIAFRPWQKLCSVRRPQQIFAFADTLLSWDLTGKRLNVSNTALLDPPYIFNGKTWLKNASPTTCFRHLGRAAAVFVDGHCEVMPLEGPYVHKLARIGSVGLSNAPHYVPDYQDWSISKP